VGITLTYCAWHCRQVGATAGPDDQLIIIIIIIMMPATTSSLSNPGQ
jgi:hypothetical protein